jgi:hypothetical protein
MVKRIVPGLIIALAVIVVGLVFWSQHKEAASHTIPLNAPKPTVEQQIQGVQNSTSMPPAAKEAAIARIRAFNRNVKK